jgi:hypothetical protein
LCARLAEPVEKTDGEAELGQFNEQRDAAKCGKCGETPIWGMLLYYTSNANFKGSDTAVVDSFTETGRTTR